MDLGTNLLQRGGGINNVVPLRIGSCPGKIGITNPLKKGYCLLLKPVQLPPVTGSLHASFYRSIQKHHVIWPQFSLNQILQQCNMLLWQARSEEHTSELQSRPHLVCRLLLEKKKKQTCIIHL